MNANVYIKEEWAQIHSLTSSLKKLVQEEQSESVRKKETIRLNKI